MDRHGNEDGVIKNTAYTSPPVCRAVKSHYGLHTFSATVGHLFFPAIDGSKPDPEGCNNCAECDGRTCVLCHSSRVGRTWCRPAIMGHGRFIVVTTETKAASMVTKFEGPWRVLAGRQQIRPTRDE